jgi:hypothetical protein
MWRQGKPMLQQPHFVLAIAVEGFPPARLSQRNLFGRESIIQQIYGSCTLKLTSSSFMERSQSLFWAIKTDSNEKEGIASSMQGCQWHRIQPES